MEISNIKDTEMKVALDLVWKVFLEFEAPDYIEEGIKEFKKLLMIIVGLIQKNFIELLKMIKYVVLLQLKIILI